MCRSGGRRIGRRIRGRRRRTRQSRRGRGGGQLRCCPAPEAGAEGVAAVADRLCHRVAIMDGGQIIALDTPHGLKSRIGPPEQVTLEDVFLNLTGRGLRD